MAEGLTVRVEGLNECVRSLRKLGDDLGDLKEANNTLGREIASRASAVAPRRSGTLAGSIKTNKAAKKVQIKAGGARAAYAGVIEYGWPARNIRPQPFLRKAAFENRNYIVEQYEKNIKQVINKYDFD